jgi:hypothetical protein
MMSMSDSRGLCKRQHRDMDTRVIAGAGYLRGVGYVKVCPGGSRMMGSA